MTIKWECPERGCLHTFDTREQVARHRERAHTTNTEEPA